MSGGAGAAGSGAGGAGGAGATGGGSVAAGAAGGANAGAGAGAGAADGGAAGGGQAGAAGGGAAGGGGFGRPGGGARSGARGSGSGGGRAAGGGRRGALVGAGVVAAVPLVVGLVGAGVLTLGGDRREVVLTSGLAAAVAASGAVLSAIGALVVLLLARRRARRRRAATALSAEFERGRALERAHHRRFLARLDHELKNPITAIRATVVAHDLAASPQLAVIDDQAQRLATLVGDLRKLSELETRPLDLERLDLEQLATEAVAALVQQRPDTAGRVTVSVTRVPWAVPAVAGDPDLLSLAIDNVLSNAAKFATTGPIELRLREQDGWAVLEVADAGRGIPEADLPVVFDELARAGNARDVPGSGLGLTLVATVLRRHGGEVTVRSLPGSGTVVTLRLPGA
ncbi:HAMP domain-containing sensor histidine kinase [Herbiconiux sp. KACC 21604]|uniref:sensor histidine kinase n=1 Tax=unclassified Herbiconiux TaxID=2618217 RepID=UPI0014918CDC|nr:HAMP domain-containing sensor histidine kinase [Herbiconiux sp. SALV-R1]QJU55258.1 HAMP domain-containing histidine kinase [Herbiconiux sp. SALV-R1]WPO86425.1 HAMP domain-containing sensor histidine kinase [Herbiconiux sp. KACC 21604]